MYNNQPSRGKRMQTERERRVRRAMFPEGAAVLVRVDGEYVPGIVHTAGWQTGTYRIKVGRRLHFVSLTQVRANPEPTS
jgi:hypothetical protein